MPNELPIPDELLSLIEKREGVDRREAERRDADSDGVSAAADRRTNTDRRQHDRRDQQ